jgi:type I restriction enzyme S subunit
MIRLGDVLNVTAGQAAPKEFSNNGLPFIRAGHLEGLLDGNKLENLPKASVEIAQKYKLKKIPLGTIVFAKSGMSATLNRVFITDQDAYFVSHLAGILPNNQVSNQFLSRYLSWYNPSKLILDSAYPSIRLEDINNLQIPLPPLETQQKIAAILDAADTLRQKDKALVAKYDELAQALFLDMFGDPVSNPKGWEILNLDIICDEIIDCPHSTPKYVDVVTEYPCIRTTELKKGNIEWGKMKYLSKEGYTERTKRLKPISGDIIYGREGSYGDAAIIPKNTKMSLGQRVMLFRPNKNYVNSVYLHSIVRSNFVYRQAVKVNSGSTVGHVNVKDIKKFKIIIPLLELQNQFAERVAIIEQQKALAQDSLEKSEELFNSLLQKAFKGELA